MLFSGLALEPLEPLGGRGTDASVARAPAGRSHLFSLWTRVRMSISHTKVAAGVGLRATGGTPSRTPAPKCRVFCLSAASVTPVPPHGRDQAPSSPVRR